MLKTEMRNSNSTHIDGMDTLSQVRLMNEENFNAVRAVEAALPQIAAACDAVSAAIAAGGHVYYVGAGTSGRLGVLDASECPPTFGVPHEMFVGIIAGGYEALYKAGEGNEDDPVAAVTKLQEYGLCAKDVVVGISAAGGAAFVLKAIEYAASLGCATIGVTSNEDSRLALESAFPIVTDTGAEVITGSTRLKAGTAQKLVLNMLSTVSMIHNGYVYENMMINLKPSNIKLKGRVVRIVREILEIDEETAVGLLDRADWNIKKSIEIYQLNKMQ